MYDIRHPFKEGDEVICVDASERENRLLYRGKYTVAEAYRGSDQETPMIKVDAIPEGYFASRFEAYDPNAKMIADDGEAEEEPVKAVDTADGEALSAAIGRTP